MVIMNSFEENLKEYFIIDAEYIMLDHSNKIIVTCTGFVNKNFCMTSSLGSNCTANVKLGLCDGQWKPTFEEYPRGYCAYRGAGDDRFVRVQNTNERW